eukprot:TRINITY_DN71676_c0_g1_i1.p1 TRINITY_DN71676_c0_g1~~TRINITY_DN71676_c0_g1_i1.p1  ORF type:complete len:461 (-),score=58.49 TRINITY_DN71676_c0_g1_i1:95-1477(-)
MAPILVATARDGRLDPQVRRANDQTWTLNNLAARHEVVRQASAELIPGRRANDQAWTLNKLAERHEVARQASAELVFRLQSQSKPLSPMPLNPSPRLATRTTPAVLVSSPGHRMSAHPTVQMSPKSPQSNGELPLTPRVLAEVPPLPQTQSSAHLPPARLSSASLGSVPAATLSPAQSLPVFGAASPPASPRPARILGSPSSSRQVLTLRQLQPHQHQKQKHQQQQPCIVERQASCVASPRAVPLAMVSQPTCAPSPRRNMAAVVRPSSSGPAWPAPLVPPAQSSTAPAPALAETARRALARIQAMSPRLTSPRPSTSAPDGVGISASPAPGPATTAAAAQPSIGSPPPTGARETLQEASVGRNGVAPQIRKHMSFSDAELNGVVPAERERQSTSVPFSATPRTAPMTDQQAGLLERYVRAGDVLAEAKARDQQRTKCPPRPSAQRMVTGRGADAQKQRR